MAKKTYIIKDKGKGQLDTVDPNSLVSISEQTASNGVQSIVPGDNISVDNTDPQNPIVSAEVDTDGFMTLNSENEVTEDWSIKKEDVVFKIVNNMFGIQTDTQYSIIGNNSINFGDISTGVQQYIGKDFDDNTFSINLRDTDSHIIIDKFGIDINIDDYTCGFYPTGLFGSSSLTNSFGIFSDENDYGIKNVKLPITGIADIYNAPYLITSINNTFADEYGNIEIEAGGGGIQSIQAGDNITVDSTDPQNPIISSTGTTPTLSEVLAEGNIADRGIGFEGDSMYGIYQLNSDDSYSEIIMDGSGQIMIQSTSDINEIQTEFRILPTGVSVDNVNNTEFKGLYSGTYHGANYDDNTYVQKKYVDDAIDAIPTPSLTLEEARQNGNVLEGNVEMLPNTSLFVGEDSDKGATHYLRFNEEMGIISTHLKGEHYINVMSNNIYLGNSSTDPDYPERDINLQLISGNVTPLAQALLEMDASTKGLVGSNEFDKQEDRKAFAQIADVEDFYTTITGYDAGETQTLKNVNGVLTWVTD